jgi:hypothetical protein
MPPKRWKTAKRVRDDEDDETIPVTTAKKVKTEGMQKDSEGNEFWEVSDIMLHLMENYACSQQHTY